MNEFADAAEVLFDFVAHFYSSNNFLAFYSFNILNKIGAMKIKAIVAPKMAFHIAIQLCNASFNYYIVC